MNKALLVALREYMENLKTKTFWIGIMAFPLILVLALVIGVLMEKGKDVRHYAVIDRSGWLLKAVEERAALPDMEKVITSTKELYEKGGKDFEALPELCYSVSFLRTYCTFLNLRPDRFIDSFRACAAAKGMRHAPRTPRTDGPTWREGLLTWAAICAMLLLGWVTYATVVRPKAEITDRRVEAGTREMVVPRSPADSGF